MQPFQRNGKLCTPLAPRQLVDFIHDHVPDLLEMLPEALSHKERLNSFRSGNKEIRGVERLLAALCHWRISMPHSHRKT